MTEVNPKALSDVIQAWTRMEAAAALIQTVPVSKLSEVAKHLEAARKRMDEAVTVLCESVPVFAEEPTSGV